MRTYKAKREDILDVQASDNVVAQIHRQVKNARHLMQHGSQYDWSLTTRSSREVSSSIVVEVDAGEFLLAYGVAAWGK